MKSKAFLVVLLFLIWSLASGWYYVCTVKGKCPTNNISETSEKQTPVFSFDKGESTPVLGANLADFKESISQLLIDSNTLEIIGLYDANEPNETSFDNLGLARAVEVQQVFAELPNERINLSSEATNFGAQMLSLDGVKFRIVVRNDFVQETDFGAILYFEEDLTAKVPAKLNAYLKMFAIDNDTKIIDIIGHTDDTGGEGENFQLGLQRANMIRDILVAEGLSPDNVTASSKGQTEPMADNSTDVGRAKNRRVEIFINK